MKIILLLVALFLSAHGRVISARKNAVFYAKGNPRVIDSDVKRWVSNIHILANQAQHTMMASLVLFSMVALWDHLPFIVNFFTSSIIAILTSACASYGWQKWINLGSGLPEVDLNERREFELVLLGRSYWIPKFWWGHRRLYISILSGWFLIALLLIINFLYL